MLLSQWLKTNGKTGQALAVELGVHPVTISKWIAGTQCPRPEMVVQIGAITGGDVTATDLMAPFLTARNITAQPAGEAA